MYNVKEPTNRSPPIVNVTWLHFYLSLAHVTGLIFHLPHTISATIHKAPRTEGGSVCAGWRVAICVWNGRWLYTCFWCIVYVFVYVSFLALIRCLFSVCSVFFFGQLYECDRMCVFGTFLVHFMSVFVCAVLCVLGTSVCVLWHIHTFATYWCVQ